MVFFATVTWGRHMAAQGVQNEYSYYYQLLLFFNSEVESKSFFFFRVAIILFDRRAFPNISFSEGQQLKGDYVLQRRHLEMLGYCVVEIPILVWNAMYMSDPKDKQTYLKNKIWKNIY